MILILLMFLLVLIIFLSISDEKQEAAHKQTNLLL